MNAGEGCAGMADAAGNLLLYVNFDTIYNARHVAMTHAVAWSAICSSNNFA